MANGKEVKGIVSYSGMNYSGPAREKTTKRTYFSKKENNVLKIYLNDIEKLRLTPEEEKRYIEQTRDKDEEVRANARKKLVESNLGFVVSRAFKYEFSGLLPLLDLVQEGSINLVYALEKFNPNKRSKPTTHAAKGIDRTMRAALATQGRPVHLPKDVPKDIFKIRGARAELVRELEREPTNEEVAKRAGLDITRLKHLYQSATNFISIHSSIKIGEETTYEDVTEDTASVDRIQAQEKEDSFCFLREIIERTLDERERKILYQEYGFDGNSPKSLEKISRTEGVSSERIRQIKEKALKKIKDSLRRMNGGELEALASFV